MVEDVEEEKEEGWGNSKSDAIGISCANAHIYIATVICMFYITVTAIILSFTTNQLPLGQFARS